MKKLLAILLALGLVLVSVAAMADGEIPVPEEVPDPTVAESQGDDDSGITAYFHKVYVDATGSTTAATVFPKETLKFAVSIPTGVTNPDNNVTTISVDDKTITQNTDPTQIDIKVPTASTTNFKVPGVYKYIIKEVQGNTEGMTYDTTTEIKVDVYVVYDTSTESATDTKVLGVNAYTEVKTDGKTDTIYNVYEVGDLTVGKNTTGNMADTTMPFLFEVEFTPTGKVWSDITIDKTNGATAYSDANATTEITSITGNGWDSATKFYVKAAHGQSLKFTNIPAGVTYTVKEVKCFVGTELKAINPLDSADVSDSPEDANDVTAYYVENEVDTTPGTITAKGNATVTIKNSKEIHVPTGITLDFVPYVMIMALAGIALVALKARKKEN